MYKIYSKVVLTILIVAAILGFSVLLIVDGFPETRYNAMENRWETVPDNSNWSNKYNAMENDWSYQPSNSTQEYNAMNNSWDWSSGHNPRGNDDN